MYQAGWGRHEIMVEPRGHAMHGYGQWHHRARESRTPLFARALFVRDESGRTLDLCCLDLGYVTLVPREMSEDRSEVPRESPRFAFEERRQVDRRLPVAASLASDAAPTDTPDD